MIQAFGFTPSEVRSLEVEGLFAWSIWTSEHHRQTEPLSLWFSSLDNQLTISPDVSEFKPLMWKGKTDVVALYCFNGVASAFHGGPWWHLNKQLGQKIWRWCTQPDKMCTVPYGIVESAAASDDKQTLCLFYSPADNFYYQNWISLFITGCQLYCSHYQYLIYWLPVKTFLILVT